MFAWRKPLRLVLLCGVACVLLVAGAQRSSAAEAYYLLLFGQQQMPNVVSHSHTFATFVKASWAEDGSAPRLEVLTISWLPARMRIRPLAVMPECGRNCDLDTSLRWAQANSMRTSLWGPYQIRPEVYHAAVQQANLLASGQVLYKINDLGYRSDEVANCIRAVSGIVTGPQRGLLDPGWGDSASIRVLYRLEPWIIRPNIVHAWIGSALGLDCHPIIYRDRIPRSSTGPLLPLLGGEQELPTYGRPLR